MTVLRIFLNRAKLYFWMVISAILKSSCQIVFQASRRLAECNLSSCSIRLSHNPSESAEPTHFHLFVLDQPFKYHDYILVRLNL